MPHSTSSVVNSDSDVKPFSNFPPTYLSVRQFSERHPCFSQGSLRALIFAARSRQSSQGEIPGNGLESALVRINTKVLINEARFFEWLERQGS